jgi:hypothetical protein
MAIKRKQYVVDKKFQLGTTFTVIGVIFLIVALIIALIAFNASRNNHKLAEIVDVQDNIVQALISHASSLETDNVKKTAETKGEASGEQIELRAIASDHYSNIEDMKKMVKYNTLILASVVFLVVIQGIVLFFILILKTHRIAGPIFVMSMYMRQIVDGKIPDTLRPLRKKDEFKSFYDLFGQMVETMRAAKKGSGAKITAAKAVKKAVKRR